MAWKRGATAQSADAVGEILGYPNANPGPGWPEELTHVRA